jgi:hypothetical protein
MVMNDTATLCLMYKDNGIEGLYEDGITWIFDYLLARTWSAYEWAGLPAKTYTPKSYANCTALWVALQNILQYWLAEWDI